MKLGNVSFDKPNEAILVLPFRGQDLIFKAQAVLDFTVFEKLCPRPQPKVVHAPGKTGRKLTEDSGYLKSLDRWAGMKTAWMVVESLKATPGLEWETVDPEKPETWNNYKTELQQCKFSDLEIQRIEAIVFEANSMDESKLQEARERFLAGQVVVSDQLTSPTSEVTTTPSGEPVNDSV